MTNEVRCSECDQEIEGLAVEDLDGTDPKDVVCVPCHELSSRMGWPAVHEREMPF